AFLFERDALRLESGQFVDGRFHTPTRRAKIRLRAFELGAHVGESRLQLSHAPRRIDAARLGRIQLGAPIDVLAMQPIDVRLKVVAPIFALAHALAGELQAMLEVMDFVRESAYLRAHPAQS